MKEMSKYARWYLHYLRKAVLKPPVCWKKNTKLELKLTTASGWIGYDYEWHIISFFKNGYLEKEPLRPLIAFGTMLVDALLQVLFTPSNT
jgi:hypothetical protein